MELRGDGGRRAPSRGSFVRSCCAAASIGLDELVGNQDEGLPFGGLRRRGLVYSQLHGSMGGRVAGKSVGLERSERRVVKVQRHGT